MLRRAGLTVQGPRMHLRDGVFVARTGGRFILLDLNRDRYLSVKDGVSNDEMQKALAQAGLLADAEEAGKPFAETEFVVPREMVVSTRTRIGPITIAHVFMAHARARRMLRHAGLPAVVYARRSLPDASDAHAYRITNAAHRFRAAAPLVCREGECLVNSLALLLYLGRDARAVSWVFGVKAMPFAAHCWVQAGDRLLNETLDGASGYTPIMVA